MASCNLILLVFGILTYVFSASSTTTDPPSQITSGQTTQGLTTPAAGTPPSSESTPIDRNTDLAVCTCDLTASSCDVNCCCDEDCSSDDRLAFSRCDDEYTPIDSQACVRSEIVFRENSPYEVTTDVPGLFCVQYDNYEERNFYEIPDPLNDTAEFDRYESRYGTHSFSQQSSSSIIQNTFYKSGDAILTVFESLALGYLTQSDSLTSGLCTDYNPTGFLISKSTSCVRMVDSLTEQCGNLSAIDAATYFTGFKVVSNPELFMPLYEREMNRSDVFTTQAPTTDTVAMDDSDVLGPLYNSSLLLAISPDGPHTCIDIHGVALRCNITDIPSPELDVVKDADDDDVVVCSNLLQQVEYTLEYNGTSGIASVSAAFTFRVVPVDTTRLTQSFSTQYSQLGATDTFRRSGHPGYITGEPVMAGHLTEDINDEGDTVYAIEVDSDRKNWLTMAATRSAADSRCGDSKQRQPVDFGVNMRSGCLVSFFYNNISELCNLTQWEAWNALVGPNPVDYIASFGNSEFEKVGDWVQILGLKKDGPNQPQEGNVNDRSCPNVLTGLNIQIVYANVGALDNPQPKILGARHQYRYQDRLSFQCIGPFCHQGNDGLEQRFEITSSVEFIDISTSPVGVSAEIPSISARLPEDFFYPFS